MKKLDLIKCLQKLPGNPEVQFGSHMIKHQNCGFDSPCYCGEEEIRFDIRDVDIETLDVNRWKLKTPVIMLTGSEK
jgi:hypothetical protein